MIRLYQPINSNLCGQTCVAMVCNVAVEDVCKLTGRKATTARMLIGALNIFDIKVSCVYVLRGVNKIKRRKKYPELPDNCICRVRSKGEKRSHWILLWGGKTYDPYPVRVPWEYISSYIEIIS